MATQEHIGLLRLGVEAWNLWRVSNPLVQPNFNYADLHGAQLAEAYLRGAILSVSDLEDANLERAILVDASLIGAFMRRVNLRGARLFKADLFQASLGEADLRGADLRETRLDQANLRGADLREADLRGASLKNADLTEARLDGADLGGCQLREALLMRASCQGANLAQADLTSASLQGTDLGEAIVGWTRLNDLDLSGAVGLEGVVHLGPSSVGLDTIFRCGTKIPESFLQGAGVPDIFLTYMASLLGQAFEFFSCCVRCSAEDRRLGERIFADLRARGVRTWFRPDENGRASAEIDQTVKTFDRLVVVCSASSLRNQRILADLDQALDRQANRGAASLFPVQVDEYLTDGWYHPRKSGLLDRGVSDFSGWEHSVDRYDAAFTDLLERLAPDVAAREAQRSGRARP